MEDNYWATEGPIVPIDFLPDSPFKRPDWRWRRAAWLLTMNQHCDHRIDDAWVARARRFQASLKHPDLGERSQQHSDHLDAAVADALGLRREEAEERRELVEAYLLTGEPFAGIAAHASLTEQAVEAYHQLFYTVRDYLRATDWIMGHAVGGDAWHGFPDRASVWKFVGFKAGARVLEVVIAITMDTPLPAWLLASCKGDPVYEEVRLRLRGKLTLAALTVASLAEYTELVEIHDQMQRLERRFESRPDKCPSTLDTMKVFLKRLTRPPSSKKPVVSEAAQRSTHEPAPCGRGPAEARFSARITKGDHDGVEEAEQSSGQEPPSTDRRDRARSRRVTHSAEGSARP